MRKKIFALPLWYIVTILLTGLGQLAGAAVVNLVSMALPDETYMSAAWQTGGMYLSNIGLWLVFILAICLIKPNCSMLRLVGAAARGNNAHFLLIGFALGFGLNGLCALIAMLNGDIYLYFDSFEPLSFVLIFLAVFIQSSAEELVCRCYLYEKLRRSYVHPEIAIFGNALLFALLHLMNDGVTVLSVLNIFLVGVLFSLLVYYYDSLWCAFALHTAWNFTQNILLGLPNSGIVVPYSVFKLDAARATDSFAYNTGFGIEGTLTADLVLLCACIATYLLGRKHRRTET